MLENRNYGFIGIKGSGKSTLARSEALKSSRVILFDSIHQYNLDGLAWTNDFSRLKEFTRRQKTFHVVYLPPIEEDERADALDAVLKLAALLGNVIVVVDEVDLYCDSSWIHPKLKSVAQYGRHVEVSLFWTARRISDVHPKLRSQTDAWAFFRQEEPIDIEIARKRLGDDADRLLTLPNYTAILKEQGQISEYNGTCKPPT